MNEDDFKRLLDASAAETRRHFDVAAESIETKVQLVAESVLNLERKYDRLSDRMDRGFADTQAMIRFSHAELDRRVRTLEDSQRALEESLAGIQARLERLESSTH